mgnify:CR=1 FL=1
MAPKWIWEKISRRIGFLIREKSLRESPVVIAVDGREFTSEHIELEHDKGRIVLHVRTSLRPENTARPALGKGRPRKPRPQAAGTAEVDDDQLAGGNA